MGVAHPAPALNAPPAKAKRPRAASTTWNLVGVIDIEGDKLQRTIGCGHGSAGCSEGEGSGAEGTQHLAQTSSDALQIAKDQAAAKSLAPLNLPEVSGEHVSSTPSPFNYVGCATIAPDALFDLQSRAQPLSWDLADFACLFSCNLTIRSMLGLGARYVEVERERDQLPKELAEAKESAALGKEAASQAEAKLKTVDSERVEALSLVERLRAEAAERQEQLISRLLSQADVLSHAQSGLH